MSAVCSGVHGMEPPLQARPVTDRTSATFPAVPLRARFPVVSGVGSAPLGVVPAASWTRWYCPGAREPARSTLLEENGPVPVALAYWTDQPSRETVAALR